MKGASGSRYVAHMWKWSIAHDPMKLTWWKAIELRLTSVETQAKHNIVGGKRR